VQNPFLIGTQVYLRPLELADAPTVAPWINDPDVRATLLMYRPINQQFEEGFIGTIYKSEHDLALGISLPRSDRLIGVVGLHQIDFKNSHAQFGMLIGEKQEWGKGYGTEATSLMVAYAFGTLNLNRVWLHVYSDNSRGIRAYERVGFQREGLLRQENYRDGRYGDTIAMAILRQEWAPRTDRPRS
jgi:diamine N-acetyltransferase